MTCPRGQSDLNAGPVLRRRGSGGEETLCSWFRFSRLIQKSLTLFCPRANYYMAPVQTLLLQLSNARVTVACNGGVNIEAWMATELSRADGGYSHSSTNFGWAVAAIRQDISTTSRRTEWRPSSVPSFDASSASVECADITSTNCTTTRSTDSAVTVGFSTTAASDGMVAIRTSLTNKETFEKNGWQAAKIHRQSSKERQRWVVGFQRNFEYKFPDFFQT